MSYLRLDNREFENHSLSLMTADGKYKPGRYGLNQGHALAAMVNRSTPVWRGSATPDSWLLNMYGAQSTHQSPQPQLQHLPQHLPLPAPSAPKPLKIRGVQALMKYIGYPDITDRAKGGIAIWASNTLRKRGYKFLHRVEIIDESVPSLYPIKHFSNVYIWVHINLTETMICNVNQMSTDIFYDRGKELLIVRSDSIDTAVAQAALVGLYSQGKVSYYDITNNSMLENYYCGISKSKTRKALYTVLNNLVKR